MLGHVLPNWVHLNVVLKEIVERIPWIERAPPEVSFQKYSNLPDDIIYGSGFQQQEFTFNQERKDLECYDQSVDW